ncbi:hypothetical protein NPIL_551591 [Nephila pilipes]|uniref:Uncharacterized protein n=1 Tax=Nephila pilipes TaxID=299642 RepID=A0A8X6JJ09_NEPPI|nr:hypothetical protein NPIL_551591 [Nephila pilipes]
MFLIWTKNNDLSQNDPPYEINFKTQKEKEAAVSLIQTDTLYRQEKVRKHRMSAKEGLELQAKKMLKVSNLPGDKVGDIVKLRIPDVDRARSDPRNLLAVILEVQNEGLFQL